MLHPVTLDMKGLNQTVQIKNAPGEPGLYLDVSIRAENWLDVKVYQQGNVARLARLEVLLTKE